MQAKEALAGLEREAQALYSEGEPHAAKGKVRRLDPAKYRGRTWATRKDLWVDRLASAWLIKRFIDGKAKFLWIDRPRDRPRGAIGFDFDGAEFTHVDNRITFETLLASFGLTADRALMAIGEAVHFLDVGGIPVADARGLETILESGAGRAVMMRCSWKQAGSSTTSRFQVPGAHAVVGLHCRARDRRWQGAVSEIIKQRYAVRLGPDADRPAPRDVAVLHLDVRLAIENHPGSSFCRILDPKRVPAIPGHRRVNVLERIAAAVLRVVKRHVVFQSVGTGDVVVVAVFEAPHQSSRLVLFSPISP